TEQAFNAIWGVKGQRTLLRKVSDYTSIMVVVPFLFIAATSITTTFQNQEIVQWMLERTYLDTFLLVAARIFPYVSIWVALLFLYRVIPSVQVRFSSALMGAVIAGALWQWAQWGYIHFQVGVARANAIYGTLSALPVFMAWLYTSWLIVLLGVEVAYAHQNLRTIRRENRHSQLSFANRQLLALAMLQRIAESFSGEREPWSVEELAADLDLPARLVREVSRDLIVAGILNETNHELPRLHPSRELDRIGVADVLQALAGKGGGWEGGSNKSVVCLRQLLADVERGGRESLAGLTLRSLISSCGEEGGASTESSPPT
ncbi:MAG TPA: YihY/virulence factor BrkB family protein, partial [Geobacterales bacterium]|nr:YihY/virulence factor BrkB family protein [Geobacterales bacterium]